MNIDWFQGLNQFFDSAGWVLWPIAASALLMWYLIAERYLLLWFSIQPLRQQLQQQWHLQQAVPRHYKKALLQGYISELSLLTQRGLTLLKTLIAICPLLGLLGTVSGMIQVFDGMALQGSIDGKTMAAGVSSATLPTMAGMVVALSGLYFHARLSSQMQALLHRDRRILGDN